MRLLLFGFLFVGACWGAGTHGIAHTDIVLRSVNFLLFLGIVWYAISSPLKRLLEDRRAKIAGSLNALQEQLQTIKSEKENAIKALEMAKQEASQIVSNAKQEAFLLTQKYEQQTKNAIEKLLKEQQDRKDKEALKTQQAVIDEVLEKLFASDQVSFETPTYVHLLEKAAG
ncbi:F0F1 ATP synthase subunit B family protein [Helicobacter cynogastricus]|uniref:F0F1 ATP synthase subunit B family protein n=1 Tax=Helicobacter cynogastricus TaxID=329937 RepID=UPI000CF0E52B|nr:hypothetical protein [Helicobacter cynogastricus]